MKILTHAFPLSLSLSLGSLLLLAPGCGSSPQSGLRSCFDTGSSVVCVQSAVLSTADRDVDSDGTPDKFVCADDDNDDHDRGRDRDENGSGSLAASADEDHDGVSDDFDCGHRMECKILQNKENGGEDGETIESHAGALKSGASDGTGGSSSGDDSGHSGGMGGQAGSSGGGGPGNMSGDDGMEDRHQESGCAPPTAS